jgi:hypothetical protein
MSALIIQYAIAGACLLFVVSLPIWKLPIAATLRRIAAALFLAALLPSLFFGVIAPAPTSADAGSGPTASSSGPNALEVLGAIVILSVVSYAILAIRKRLRTTSKDAWSEFVSLRSSGKRSVGDPRSTHTPSLFDEEPGP